MRDAGVGPMVPASRSVMAGLVGVGACRAEMVGLKLTDVDLDLDVLLVLGKGRRERTLPFGRKAEGSGGTPPPLPRRPATREVMTSMA